MFGRCLILLALASCAKPTATPTPDAHRASTVAADAAPSAVADCVRDRDCELVTDGCCDCNQGGRRIAVPVGKAPAHDCSGVMCPQMISNDPSCLGVARAYCREGKCAITGIDDKPGERPNRRFERAPSPVDPRVPPRR